MRNLIVPLAGRSSRFPDMRPKWMLTHPKTNKFMVTEALKGLNLDSFDRIYFTTLLEHRNKYGFIAGFLQEMDELGIRDRVNVIELTQSTSSQSETVYETITRGGIEGSVFVKDADNYYECEIGEGNQVAYFNLNSEDHINARNKSYIEMDVNGILTNIVEKNVISSTFSCGGYGFADAKEFCDSFLKLKGMEGECYISHVIYDMMLSGAKFKGVPTSNYLDWGTLEAWTEYKKEFKTLFCDIDGTLITNTSIQFAPLVGHGKPIEDNVECLRNAYSTGKVHIVLTTSRPESYRDVTVDELKEKDIPYDQLVMGLPHCKRVVINDFARSNTYPSCEAINIPRNQPFLNEYLK